MLFFANFPTGRITNDIAFYVASADGTLIRSQMITGPFPALLHDFVVTRDFVIFAFCPVSVSIKRAMEGAPLIAWEPEKGTHVGVMPRAGSAQDVRWFAGEPCMAWHLMNAFNQGDKMVIDVCQQEAPVFPFADGSPTDQKQTSQFLTRWELDWAVPGRFEANRLSNVRCEYRQFDERWAGRSYRHGYVACEDGPGSDDIFHRGIGHFGHLTSPMRVYSTGPHCAVAEPIFVPKDGATTEGEGYLMTNIFDEERNASHLAIFDAENTEAGPIARAMLDHRVPVGFHASWRPDVISE